MFTKGVIAGMLLFATLVISVISLAEPQKLEKDEFDNTIQTISSPSQPLPQGLQHLLQAYPQHLASAANNTLYWHDQTQMHYDDGKQDKDFQTLLNHPDLQDQMSIPYPINTDYQQLLVENFDPGRIRHQTFFKKMYGSTADEVRKKLVPIVWLPETVGKRLWVTSINGVNQKLQAVSNELDKLPKHLKKYVTKTAGTFNWRMIKDTQRLSAHSFGIAIDINVEYGDYWKWSKTKPPQKLQYKNRIPLQIVEIFEKHGFIWGGKWYHYDTMHFEYRPELLLKPE